MSQASKPKDELYAIATLVVSPQGHLYEQSSLKQCAAFMSQLHARMTGVEQSYIDHSAIRAKLRLENGEFSGVLTGWRVMEFPNYAQLRSYMWDRNGVPTVPSGSDTVATAEARKDEINEAKKDGTNEGEKDGILEEEKYRTHQSTAPDSTRNQDEIKLKRHRVPMVSVEDEFERVFG